MRGNKGPRDVSQAEKRTRRTEEDERAHGSSQRSSRSLLHLDKQINVGFSIVSPFGEESPRPLPVLLVDLRPDRVESEAKPCFRRVLLDELGSRMEAAVLGETGKGMIRSRLVEEVGNPLTC